MNRTFIIAAAALVLLLAFWRPARAPAGIVAAPPPPPAQHSGRGHSFHASAAGGAIVYVAGAVERAGLYKVAADARVQDAVRLAGGLRADADPLAVNLAAHVSDGEEIAVPRVGEATPRPSRRRPRKAAAAAEETGRVDINAADAGALASLPGVGATLASRIVEYRRLNGPFESVDELLDVAGMTQRRVDAVAPYVSLHDAP